MVCRLWERGKRKRLKGKKLGRKKSIPVNYYQSTFKTCRLLKIVRGIEKQCSNKTPGINTQFPSNKKYQGHNYPVPELFTKQQVLGTVRELGDWFESG